jgi:hypothetical protein
VLPPLPDGSKLKAVCFTVSDPKRPSHFDRQAGAGRSVDANLNFVKRIHLPRLGFLFGVECLEAALAVLVHIINDPSLTIFVWSEVTLAMLAIAPSPLFSPTSLFVVPLPSTITGTESCIATLVTEATAPIRANKFPSNHSRQNQILPAQDRSDASVGRSATLR